jgi:uncharacterized protein YaeQ
VIAYGGKTSDIWWQGVRSKVERLRNVQVLSLGDGVAAALGRLAERTMRLQCTAGRRRLDLERRPRSHRSRMDGAEGARRRVTADA